MKQLERRWNAIAKRLDLSKPITGAEVGVWMGRMSQELFKCIPKLYLYLIDRWCITPKGDSYFKGSLKISRMPQSKFDEAYKNTVSRVSAYKGKYKILRMESVEASKHIQDESLDFCFIDADHSYYGVCRDISAWLPKVKKGGWICGHDYDHPEQGQVKKAVHDTLGNNIEVDINRTWFYHV